MARARFKENEQILFFKEVLHRSGYTPRELAKECGVVPRTLNSWRRGQFFPDYDAVFLLSQKFGIPIQPIGKLDDYWYVMKGARKGRVVGTYESRSKGGKISQQRRREDPEKYRKLGCMVRKNFPIPAYSEKFAELIGVLLGDGSINKYQVKISLDSERDKEYIKIVAELINSLLGEWPSITPSPRCRCTDIVLSGANLVEILENADMQRGNKIVNQVRFPEWIRDDLKYRTACVRGLFDTDGGLYFHAKPQRKYLGWCFASASAPLLADVMITLQDLGFNVKKVGERKLYMYSLKDISRYMEIVGSNNPKNSIKLNLRKGGFA
jgi:transcriptional regulator with XRE-family HTH domain